MNSRNSQRELGRIKEPYEDRERGFALWVPIEFRGSTQGFGGIVLNDALMPSFKSALADVFGVGRFSLIEGQRCYALRCWGFHNDSIEGLESVCTGRIFTLTGWCRKHGLSAGSASPLDRRREFLGRIVRWAERRAVEARKDLARVEEGYIDWSVR